MNFEFTNKSYQRTKLKNIRLKPGQFWVYDNLIIQFKFGQFDVELSFFFFELGI